MSDELEPRFIEDSRQPGDPTEPISSSPAEASPRPANDNASTMSSSPDAPNSQQAIGGSGPTRTSPAGANSRQAKEVSTSAARPPAEPDSQRAAELSASIQEPPAGPTVHSLGDMYSRLASEGETPVLNPPGASVAGQADTRATPVSRSPALNRRPAKTKARLVKPAGAQTSPAANDGSETEPHPPQGDEPSRRAEPEPHNANAAGEDQGSEAPTSASLLDPVLGFAAEVVDDLEKTRVAIGNRLNIMLRGEEDSDGETRGFGLTEAHPDVAAIAKVMIAVQGLENEAVRNLQRVMRKHPLGPWLKRQKGIGEKQGARLLAATGDPYINSAKGAPRTVSALWAYCGLHVVPASHYQRDAQSGTAGGDQDSSIGQAATDSHKSRADGGQDSPEGHDFSETRVSNALGGQTPAEPVSDPIGAPPEQKGGGVDRDDDDNHVDLVGVAPRRRKGVKANWSGKAKMRAHLVAESCVKQRDKVCAEGHVDGCKCSPYRLKYEERRRHTAITHPEWTDGHSHNDGLRITSKEILKQLWRAAREWHLEQVRQSDDLG